MAYWCCSICTFNASLAPCRSSTLLCKSSSTAFDHYNFWRRSLIVSSFSLVSAQWREFWFSTCFRNCSICSRDYSWQPANFNTSSWMFRSFSNIFSSSLSIFWRLTWTPCRSSNSSSVCLCPTSAYLDNRSLQNRISALSLSISSLYRCWSSSFFSLNSANCLSLSLMFELSSATFFSPYSLRTCSSPFNLSIYALLVCWRLSEICLD